jgi:hypothetical protein
VEPKDAYTAAQAARVLGIGERRVRQLVAEGVLVGVRGERGALRISQQSVNEERKRRRAATGDRGAGREPRPTGPQLAALQIDALVTRLADAVGQRLEGQLELTRRAESLLRAELEEERARRLAAEARCEELERRLGELEGVAREMEARGRRRGPLSFLGRRSPRP